MPQAAILCKVIGYYLFNYLTDASSWYFIHIIISCNQVTEYLYKRIFAQKNAEIRRLKDIHTSILEVSTTTHYDAAHEVSNCICSNIALHQI